MGEIVLFIIVISIGFIYYLHQRGDSRKRLNHLLSEAVYGQEMGRFHLTCK
jgi:hypothetical protein